MVIGKRKRAVGRPRKAPCPKRPAKLVDYYCSQEEPTDECNEPATSKKRMQRMYSIAQKKKVAYYARHHGIQKASRHFRVHHKNVQRWVKNQVSSIKNPRKRVNRKVQGRKISYPQELEDKLVSSVDLGEMRSRICGSFNPNDSFESIVFNQIPILNSKHQMAGFANS